MRAVCNVAFVVQAQSFDDEDALNLWLDGLALPPGQRARPRQKNVDEFFAGFGRIG